MAGQHPDRDDANTFSFRSTLNLPQTDFPMRAESAIYDPKLLQRWQDEGLTARAMSINTGNKKYILHDGPPYANGHIHLGHAYNKILKDIMTKAYRMSGYHTPVRPGWDCHGLPIELKVTQQHPDASSHELKALCRSYAQSWVDIQRQEFKNLGVLMDWENPYLTMNFDYEATIIESFGTLVEKKFIERSNKTVAWCPVDRTVLASAEIEYKNRKDPSLYVLFELSRHQLPQILKRDEPIYFVIWTTTPWTLPLNRAVLAKRGGSYVLARVADKLVIVGEQLIAKIAELLKQPYEIITTFDAKLLESVHAVHPFVEHLEVPIILDDSVGADEGTGLVHCAPGCGPIDYEVGVKNGLEVFAPITPDGKYAFGIQPRELETVSVQDGQIWVIKKLAELGKLLYKTTINHSYPHCWRCHNGLIFRATPQWFFDLQHQQVKEHAAALLDQMEFFPPAGRNFLRATIENRWEWCLSRQRVWGVPIPALLCTICDHPYTSKDFIFKVAHGVRKEGVEYWDHVTLEELTHDELTCPQCGSTEFKKEKDILDVWFDAGVSHQAVLEQDKNLSFPADLYLEGVDQHRGWFQSSLLTSVALTRNTCTRGIMTHGFTVDEKGQKMSKSIGNVVAPQEIIAKLGTDGLRLWVASVGHDGDAVVSDTLLANVSEVFRKIRNTCRGLLMNLYDFEFERDNVSIDAMMQLDRFMLHEVSHLNSDVIERYHRGEFAVVVRKLTDFCAVELSALYLDIVKDRLYCEKPTSKERRSAQTVIWYTLDALMRLMAPIMSFTAETLSDYAQKNKKESIHLQHFSVVPDSFAFDHDILGDYENELSPAYVGSLFKAARHIQEVDSVREQEKIWEVVREMRSAVLRAIEPLRAQGLIKQSMEARITCHMQPTSPYYGNFTVLSEILKNRNESLEAFFKELCVVSQFEWVEGAEGLSRTSVEGFLVSIDHADGVKCPRCWQWDVTDHPLHLSNRCQRVLGLNK